jgi:predicted ABC-type ATPase
MNNQFLKLTGILTILFLSITFVNAQTTFTTNEVRQFMSRGEQNGIEVILNGTSVNEAKDGLKKIKQKV